MCVVLNDDLTKKIVFGIAGNAVWDAIKTITKAIFHKVKNSEVNSLTTKKTKKKLTFGINMKIDRNTGFNFRLDSAFNSETIEKPLDEIKDFVKSQEPNKTYKHPLFLYYDHKKNVWVPVDVMDQLTKKAKLDKRRPKKKK